MLKHRYPSKKEIGSVERGAIDKVHQSSTCSGTGAGTRSDIRYLSVDADRHVSLYEAAAAAEVLQ